MNRSILARIVGEDGLQGIITDQIQADDGTTYALATFDSGEQVRIPTRMLHLQTDGSMYVPLRRENLQQIAQTMADEQSVIETPTNESQVARTTTGEQITIPVIEEDYKVGKRTVETGRVRVEKVVHERSEVVDEPLLREDVEVERVTINRQVDAPPEVRRDGETVIIPVVEEVLVVEKRLILKEELHITRRQTTVRGQQTVALRSEELIVEHLPPHSDGDANRE